MKRIIRSATASVLLWPSLVLAQNTAATPALPAFQQPSAFPAIWKPYQEQPVRTTAIENSVRLRNLLQNGRLRLSLSDALALAIENNLDIAVQRYLAPIAEADLLRTSSGQAARGVPGALVPSGLSQGAIGVGVNQFQGAAGVGSAGGISGGGGAVQVPQVGTFDPAVTMNASWDHTVAPLNSVQVAGVPQVATSSAAGALGYTQLLPEGSSVTLSINGISQNSTQQFLLYNPAFVSRMALGANQPLLNGFGFLPNERFLLVARNNLKTSDQLFREQVTTTIVQVEDAYWDLATAREAIDATQHAYDAATELTRETKMRVELGTAAGIDVISAESAAAAAERDLVVAKTTLQLQEARLKTMIAKDIDPELDAAAIDPTDPLPDPRTTPAPDVTQAVATAMAHRPELLSAQQDLKNQDISARFTKNGLLPSVNAFGLFAAAGLGADALNANAGTIGSLMQDFQAQYPEYAAGVSATIPLRNRSAQADNLRARLEEQQLQLQLQRSRQQIGLEVRQAIISLVQGRAQVTASHEAVRLANESVDAEREKLKAGVSTTFDVILRERDQVAALQSDVAAVAAYAKALVDFDRATGMTLEHNGVGLSDALGGELHAAPAPAGAANSAQPQK